MNTPALRTLVSIVLVGGVAAAQTPMPSADAVLKELQAGNDHHAAKRYDHPHQTATRQRELPAEQHPHAAILSCSSSSAIRNAAP